MNMLSETEQKILEAARLEFIEKGKAGARMQNIAQNAGVNKALLHYYFRSKDKLYEEVLKETMTKLWSTLHNNLQGTENSGNDLRVLIRMIVTTFINTIKENPECVRMFLRELVDGSQTIPRILDQVIASFGNLPQRIFAAMGSGIKRGEIKPLEPPQIILNIISMCVSTFFLRPVFSLMYQKVMQRELVYDDAFYRQRIEAIVEMACDGIFFRENKA
jgi:TetR/AcrR family transcriptional regulator